MTTAQEQLTRAKAQLILSEPFFATLALKMEFIENSKVKTLKTDGDYIWYNPDYIVTLSLDQLKGVLAHEVMHPALFHHTRRGARDKKKWNKACDYAINPMLIEAGFELPEGYLMKDEFKDMTAEYIYNLLEDEPENDGTNDGESEGENGNGEGDIDPGGCGAVDDSPSQSAAEKYEEESEMREDLQQAMMNAERQGRMPAFLKRAIEEVLEAKVDWKEVLARFISEPCRDDYSFKRPNPRYLASGFYLPFLQNETTGDIIMFVDTSGSINEKLLNEFGSEMQSIASTFGKGFTVVYVDADVAGYEEIEPDGAVDLHPEGGGGTDFVPGFEWIDKEGRQPKAVVYFTDGLCDSFPEIPDYPVLWAIYSGYKDFDPPFGEVVNIL